MASRVAVISDVHGNWHALEAVLRAVDAESADELWCLGDLVGYGPRPNPCCAAVQERANKVIQQIAEAEKFDLILQDPVVFASARIDVTDKVIKALADK